MTKDETCQGSQRMDSKPKGLMWTKEQKVKIDNLTEEYHDAFNLWYEIETCP